LAQIILGDFDGTMAPFAVAWSSRAIVEGRGECLGELGPPERLFEKNQIRQSARPAVRLADIPRHQDDLEILPSAPGISRQIEAADAIGITASLIMRPAQRALCSGRYNDGRRRGRGLLLMEQLAKIAFARS